MLQEIRIHDLAIIEDLRVEFGPGLNVLSGETGAGKSIVVDALGLVAGDRAAADLLRAGAETAVVEAVFRLDRRGDVREKLESLGLEAAAELIVRRALAPGGKGRIHVNGSAATQGMLASIAGDLVEIHAQHEHQSLLHREAHLDLLDRAAGLLELRARMGEAARVARALLADREALRSSVDERLREIDYLRFQIDEIAKADPAPGEDEQLQAERSRLSHAARLAEIASGAEEAIYSGEGAIVDALGRAAALLKEGSRLDPALAGHADRVEGALRELEDAAGCLRDYAAKAVLDPERLEAVETRLEVLRKLLRKYGPGLADVRAALDAARARLEGLESHDARLAALETACARADREAGAIAAELSAARAGTARTLERRILAELRALGMPRAVFRIALEAVLEPAFGERGADRVEFLFSANEGEPPRALARIASGGELSRTMLAIQSVLAVSSEPATLVFDEADAGIGGRLADAVGQRLARLAATHQVLCVTHLPQIAAMGERHLRVFKETRGGRTTARVEALAGEARVEEIARMSGGAEVTRTTRAHARELLERASRARPAAPGRRPGRAAARGEGPSP
jgi:DNA repair protein RecN (Recombination protein N)